MTHLLLSSRPKMPELLLQMPGHALHINLIVIIPSNPPLQTSVCVHVLSSHLSPRNFFDPHVFHPERWLPSAQEPDSPFRDDDRGAFQPFFIGPRNCIGRNLAYSKMRLILARVLFNFDISLCDESRDWVNQRLWLVWEDKPLMCRLKLRGDV